MLCRRFCASRRIWRQQRTTCLDVSHSFTTDDREHFEKREERQSTLSKEVPDAVAEDDDDYRAARSEQLAQDLTTGLAHKQSRAATVDAELDVLAAGQHGESKQKLHQSRRAANQHEGVCVDRCPLTSRHTAKRSGDSCGSESTRTMPHVSVTKPSFGGTAAWKPKRTTKHDRSLTLALAKSGP